MTDTREALAKISSNRMQPTYKLCHMTTVCQLQWTSQLARDNITSRGDKIHRTTMKEQ